MAGPAGDRSSDQHGDRQKWQHTWCRAMKIKAVRGLVVRGTAGANVLRAMLWGKRSSGPTSVTFHLTGRHNRVQRLVVCRAGGLVVVSGPGRFSLGRRSRWGALPQSCWRVSNLSCGCAAPEAESYGATRGTTTQLQKVNTQSCSCSYAEHIQTIQRRVLQEYLHKCFHNEYLGSHHAR